MKRFGNRNLFLIIIFFLLAFPLPSTAGDMGDPGDPGCNPYGYRRDENGNWVLCPIDDGVYVLLGIGVIYGIKKVRMQRREEVDG